MARWNDQHDGWALRVEHHVDNPGPPHFYLTAVVEHFILDGHPCTDVVVTYTVDRLTPELRHLLAVHTDEFIRETLLGYFVEHGDYVSADIRGLT